MASLEGYTPEEIAQMASVYDSLVRNPETRELTLRATKKVNPNASVPEIDLKDAASSAIAKEREAREALEQRMMIAQAEQRVRDERQKLRDLGYSQGDVDAIEKMMIEESGKGNRMTYEFAGRHFKNSQIAATPTPGTIEHHGTFSMPQDALAALKGGRAGLKQFGRNAASEALNDLRSGRIKLH